MVDFKLENYLLTQIVEAFIIINLVKIGLIIVLYLLSIIINLKQIMLNGIYFMINNNDVND